MNTIEAMANYQTAVVNAEIARNAWKAARDLERDECKAYAAAEAARDEALEKLTDAIKAGVPK